MDRIVFPHARCSKCNGELTFCWLMDVNENRHFRIWCQPCYRLFPKSVIHEWRDKYDLRSKELPQYLTLVERGKKKPDCKQKGDYVPYRRPSANSPEAERLRRLPYAEYLQTEHWQEMRKKMLYKAHNRCQLCHSSDRLNVHHRTYERRGCEWKADLIVLCRDCHAKFHDKLP